MQCRVSEWGHPCPLFFGHGGSFCSSGGSYCALDDPVTAVRTSGPVVFAHLRSHVGDEGEGGGRKGFDGVGGRDPFVYDGGVRGAVDGHCESDFRLDFGGAGGRVGVAVGDPVCVVVVGGESGEINGWWGWHERKIGGICDPVESMEICVPCGESLVAFLRFRLSVSLPHPQVEWIKMKSGVKRKKERGKGRLCLRSVYHDAFVPLLSQGSMHRRSSLSQPCVFHIDGSFSCPGRSQKLDMHCEGMRLVVSAECSAKVCRKDIEYYRSYETSMDGYGNLVA